MLLLRHPAWLWPKKHNKDKLSPVGNTTQAMFDTGHKIEALAEALFESGPLRLILREKYNGHWLSTVLYATFIFEGSCMIFTTLRGYILRRVFLYYRLCIGLQRSSGLPIVWTICRKRKVAYANTYKTTLTGAYGGIIGAQMDTEDSIDAQQWNDAPLWDCEVLAWHHTKSIDWNTPRNGADWYCWTRGIPNRATKGWV